MKRQRYQVTGQLDLLLPNPSKSDLECIVGRIDERNGVEYLSGPRWSEDNQWWTCLANVGGMLCLVEVRVYHEETSVPN